MSKVTIVGAGITGLAVASALSKTHQVTVVARNLPGDKLTQEWSSPWAGALFHGVEGSSPREQKMQLEAFAYLWKLAEMHPESSVRKIDIHDFYDDKPLEEIWYRDQLPEFRVMAPEELPKGTKLGMSYKTVVSTPSILLPWLQKRLEEAGVKFKRVNITSLSDLKGLGHDVLVNATGAGPYHLKDVQDKKVQHVRGQTVLIKTDYDKVMIRSGKDYTYCIPRLDGTAIVGGVKQYGNKTSEVDPELRKDIFRRIHENLPKAFPSPNPADYEIVMDNVGIRPGRESGVRLEKEVINGQKVVHAYGVAGAGYVFCFGLGRAASELVDDFIYMSPLAKL